MRGGFQYVRPAYQPPPRPDGLPPTVIYPAPRLCPRFGIPTFACEVEGHNRLTTDQARQVALTRYGVWQDKHGWHRQPLCS